MRASPTTRRVAALVATLTLAAGFAVLTASPASAAPLPVNVSACGTIEGVPSLPPGSGNPPLTTNFILGTTAEVTATHLPTSAEASLAGDPYDCTSTGTLNAPIVAFTFCGNANSAGVPYTQAQALALQQAICDIDPSLAQLTGSSGGTASVSIATRSGNVAAGGGPGIGVSASQCVPVSLAAVIAGNAIPCNVAVADVDLNTTPPTGGAIFTGLFGLIPKPSPTLSITSVTGQLPLAEAAREGNSLAVSGTNWDETVPGDLVAELCNLAETSCNDADEAGLTLTPDGFGLSTLGGSVPVPAGASPGARVLRITQASDDQAATDAIEILGARTIALSSNSGGLGATITITGSGFDALQSVTVAATDGVSPVPLNTGTGSVNELGQVSGSIVISSANTAVIGVAENDNPLTQNAGQLFTFSLDEKTCAANTTTTPCVLTQEISQEVIGVALVYEQVSGNVSMSDVTLTGSPQVSSGSLEDLTITNSRGDDAAWNVQGVLLGDFVEGVPASDCAVELNHCIPADNLGWVPTAAVEHLQIEGDVADVISGPSLLATDSTDVDDATQPWIDGEGLGTSRVLCSAAQYQSGGTFGCDAALRLGVPASATAGVYTAKLQLTLT